MSYTKGPWEVHEHPHVDGDLWLSVLQGAWDITSNGASNPGVVACAKYSAMTDNENIANAKLISAAPELLEALESIIEYPDIDKYVGSIIFNDCLSVIAKAKGEE